MGSLRQQRARIGEGQLMTIGRRLILVCLVAILAPLLVLACAPEDNGDGEALQQVQDQLQAVRAQVQENQGQLEAVQGQLESANAQLATLVERVTPAEPEGQVIPEWDPTLSPDEAAQVLGDCLTGRLYGSDSALAGTVGEMFPIDEMLQGLASADDEFLPGTEPLDLVRFMGTLYGCWR